MHNSPSSLGRKIALLFSILLLSFATWLHNSSRKTGSLHLGLDCAMRLSLASGILTSRGWRCAYANRSVLMLCHRQEQNMLWGPSDPGRMTHMWRTWNLTCSLLPSPVPTSWARAKSQMQEQEKKIGFCCLSLSFRVVFNQYQFGQSWLTHSV